MTNILGINAYHGDAAASLLIDGRLVAAVEEERFNRIKHWSGFPKQSIAECLNLGKVTGNQIDHVAISFNPRANLLRKLKTTFPSIKLNVIWDRLRRQLKSLSIRDELADAFSVDVGDMRAKIHQIEHHHAHVGAGFFTSPFEEAAILSVDGMGDFTSTLTAHGVGNCWQEINRVYFPHSLGYLYSAITMYLGFLNYGDEYKVMGLAPYGEPEFVDFFRRMIYPRGDLFELNLDYFTHHRDGIRMNWDSGMPTVEPFYSKKLVAELGPVKLPGQKLTLRHENIAASLQKVTEEIILHLACRLYQTTKCNSLCVTGGVAMNSVANGKLTSQTPFQNVFIPAGAADNGTSFGSAFCVWNHVLKQPRTIAQEHAYLGSEFDGPACLEAIHSASLNVLPLPIEELVDQTTDLIISGKVVGWFQGRMEFGARALGNRSLLADPRRADMRDIINLRIKFREKFRPFAPSILAEKLHDWFDAAQLSPFMEKVFPVLECQRSRIPAVIHVDGSGRVQTVTKAANPHFYDLIESFHLKTGIPILLNTSLNENEPIVRTPAEAIACFLRTEMDALVVGPYLLHRENTPCFQRAAERATAL